MKQNKKCYMAIVMAIVMAMSSLVTMPISVVADELGNRMEEGAIWEGIVDSFIQYDEYHGLDVLPSDPNEVIMIGTAEELETLLVGGPNSAGRTFALANDIYLTREWVPVNDFRGTFDGRGHAIHNLFVLESSGQHVAGLFGLIGASDEGIFQDNNFVVTIKNLGIYIGSQGVFAGGDTSEYTVVAGGLVGASGLNSLNINNSYVVGDISSINYYQAGIVGGLVGGFIGGLLWPATSTSTFTISNSFFSGNVTTNSFGRNDGTFAGGLVGAIGGFQNDTIKISNSYSTGNIYASMQDKYFGSLIAGGLIGVGVGASIDGIAGFTITNSYTTSNVKLSTSEESYGFAFSGGVIGGIEFHLFGGSSIIIVDPNDVIINSYRLSTQVISGGTINNAGIPLTSEQMRTQSYFEDWDFDNTWTFIDGANDGFPVLRGVGHRQTQAPTGTIYVSSTSERVGQIVNVPIEIENSPGVFSVGLRVEYDSQLELIGFTPGILTLPTEPANLNINPILFNLENEILANNYTDGTLITLQFRIREDATDSFAPITVTPTTGSHRINFQPAISLQPLDFDVINGGITIRTFTFGDLNDDDRVDVMDITLLRMYLENFSIEINRSAADVNADGVINSLDLTLLRLYVAGHNVVLGPQVVAFVVAYHESSEVQISASNETAQVGEYVDVIISLDENQNGLFATSLNLDFDTSQLELVSITRGDMGTRFLPPLAPTSLMFEASSLGVNVHGAGELATARFRVLEGASGTIPVGLRDNLDTHRFSDSFPINWMPISITPVFNAGSVTVTTDNLVDRTALHVAIEEAEGRIEVNYTLESWATMQEALISARSVYADTNVTQAQIDTVASDLWAAIEVLERISSRPTTLGEAIEEAESKLPGDFIQSGWIRLQSALINARRVYENPNTTSTQRERAFNDLMTALEALVRR